MAASVGLLCLSAGKARTENLGQAMSHISQKIAPAAQNLKKSIAASAKNTPATPQMPAPTVENVLQQNGTIFIVIDNPNIGGVPFLAVNSDEQDNLGALSAAQRDRAQQLCKFLGYTEPTLSDIRWVGAGLQVLTISDDRNVTEDYTTSFVSCSKYYPDAECERETTLFPAVFSRIECKK